MKNSRKKFSLQMVLNFLVLGVGAYIIYQPIYEKNTYYDAFISAFNVTNSQFSAMFSAFSLVSLLAYFPGGILADKFSPRKLLTFSFISTGLLALWESSFPSYQVGMLIFGAMGATTTLTFWAAMIKATRQFGRSMAGESTALGSQEGVRNIGKMIIATGAVALFRHYTDINAGLASVLRYDAAICIFCGVASWFIFKDNSDKEDVVFKGGLGKQLLLCLKNPAVWLVSLIVFGSYALSANIAGYISKIGTAKFSLSVGIAATCVTFSTYVQPIGSFVGGWIGDKLGATKALALSTICLMCCAVAILMLPASPSMMIAYAAIYFVFTAFRGAARGQYYGPLREAGVPLALSGTATGLIATIGYSSDTFLPLISGKMLDSMEKLVAIKNIIIILLCFGAFSLAISAVMLKRMKAKGSADQKEVH